MAALGSLASLASAASMTAAPSAAAAGITGGLGTAIGGGGTILGGSTAASGIGAGLGSVLGKVGTGIAAIGQYQQGQATAGAARYQAQLAEREANEKTAEGQRAAEEERRLGRLRQSRARAVAAASGGGIDYDLVGRLEEDSELRALTALYGGETAANNLRGTAKARRFDGDRYRTAGLYSAGNTVLGRGASMLMKYS